jgi:hypothetical protein
MFIRELSAAPAAASIRFADAIGLLQRYDIRSDPFD